MPMGGGVHIIKETLTRITQTLRIHPGLVEMSLYSTTVMPRNNRPDIVRRCYSFGKKSSALYRIRFRIVEGGYG